MNYLIVIGCALFFGIFSTLCLRSVLEYGMSTGQIMDKALYLNDEEINQAMERDNQERFSTEDYIRYFSLVCITGIAVSVFGVWYYQQNLHYVVLTTAIISILWACSWYDKQYQLIPNRVLLYALILRVMIFAVQIAINPAEFKYFLLSSVIASMALMAAAMLCRLLSPNSVGYGDVKLLGVLGLYMGVNHVWSPIFMTLILLFIAGVYLLLFKKADRKTEIPLAPFLLAGTIAAAFLTGA